MPRTGDVVEEALNGTQRKFRAMPDGTHAEVVFAENRDTVSLPSASTYDLKAVNDVFKISCDGANLVLLQFTGTFANAALAFEISLNSTDGINGNWLPSVFSSSYNAGVSSSVTISADPGRIHRFVVTGAAWMRVRMTGITSGSVKCICSRSWSNLDPSPTVIQIGWTNISSPFVEDYNGVVNPHAMGGKAAAALPTAATPGRLKTFMTTLLGALIIKPYSIPEADWQFASPTPLNATTDAPLKAPVNGLRHYVTALQVQNSATVATDLVIKDGATIMFRLPLPAAMAVPTVITFPTPLRCSVSGAVNAACITAGAAVYVNAQGYTAP